MCSKPLLKCTGWECFSNHWKPISTIVWRPNSTACISMKSKSKPILPKKTHNIYDLSRCLFQTSPKEWLSYVVLHNSWLLTHDPYARNLKTAGLGAGWWGSLWVSAIGSVIFHYIPLIGWVYMSSTNHPNSERNWHPNTFKHPKTFRTMGKPTRRMRKPDGESMGSWGPWPDSPRRLCTWKMSNLATWTFKGVRNTEMSK